MSTVLPEGIALRNAIQWVAEHARNVDKRERLRVINEAIARYDLSPRDADYLLTYRDDAEAKPTENT